MNVQQFSIILFCVSLVTLIFSVMVRMMQKERNASLLAAAEISAIAKSALDADAAQLENLWKLMNETVKKNYAMRYHAQDLAHLRGYMRGRYFALKKSENEPARR